MLTRRIKKQLLNTKDFSDDKRAMEILMVKDLLLLRQRDDVNWTYISPALDFQVDGEYTGKYIFAGEEFKLNSKGESIINYADFAAAVIDEIETCKHIKRHISVISK